jgi:hypothetical protein
LTFDPERTDAVVVAQRLFEISDDSGHLPLTGSAEDHKIVGDRRDWPNVKQDDISRQLVRGDLDDPPGECLRFQ